MLIEWDPVTFVNLLLCIIIVIMGYLSYRKSGDHLLLYVAVAFGLFGISHAATLLGLKNLLTIPLIIDRTLAYILIIMALMLELKKTMTDKETQHTQT
jgi:hypothetical protein